MIIDIDTPQCPECWRPLANLGGNGRAPWWSCQVCPWQGSQGELDAALASSSGTHLVKVSTGLLKFPDLVCPGCYSHHCISETAAPRRGNTGYYECASCEWCGPGSEIKPISKDQADAKRDTREINQVRLEDQRRGEKGGGGRSGKSRKEDKLKVVMLGPAWDDSIAGSKSEPIDKLERHIEVSGVPGCTSEEVRDAIADLIEQDRDTGGSVLNNLDR